MKSIRLEDFVINDIRVGLLQEQAFSANGNLNAIKGPRDLLAFHIFRHSVLKRALTGNPVICSICLPSVVGSEKSLASTFIGGREIIGSEGSGWPLGLDGDELSFLAQVDFYDFDEVEVPARFLQVFGDPKRHDAYSLRWINKEHLRQCGPSYFDHRIFFHERVDVDSYPESHIFDEGNLSESDDLLIADNPYIDFFITPLGFEVGKAPYVAPYALSGGMFSDVDILVTIPSFYFQPNVAYELADRANPLTTEEAERLSVNVGPRYDLDSDAFGILYVVQNKISLKTLVIFAPL